MPKQRGGWKGKPKAKALAPAEDSDSSEDFMNDEVERFHAKGSAAATKGLYSNAKAPAKAAAAKGGKPALRFVEGTGGDDDEEDELAKVVTKVKPVLSEVSDDEDEDDYDEDEEDGGAGGSDEEDDDSDSDDELRAAAIKREDNLLNAWGKKRSTYYDQENDGEIDDEAAAKEEAEVLRLQKKRAADLDEEDATFGMALVTGKTASAGTSSASKKSKAAAAAGDVEVVTKDLGALSRAQKLELVMADTPELLGLLEELKEKVEEVRSRLAPVLAAVKAGHISGASDGISFLEVKHQLLLAYVTNITFYLLLKAEGRKVKDHPVIEQLVHIRLLLEKLRPLDAKVAHTVSRLLKAAAAKAGEGSSGAAAGSKAGAAPRFVGSHEDDFEDPERPSKHGCGRKEADVDAEALLSGGAGIARPNPGALLAHGDKKLATGMEDDDEEGVSASAKKGGKGAKGKGKAAAAAEEEEGAEEDDGVYRPLKRNAVLYEEDPATAKAEREAARRKARLSRTQLLKDLKHQYTDAPEEDAVDGVAGPDDDVRTTAAVDEKLARLDRERTAYEEDAMTRIMMSKEEKKLRRAREREAARGLAGGGSASWAALADVDAFGDMEDALAREDEATAGRLGGPSKKRSLRELEASIKASEDRLTAATVSAASSLLNRQARRDAGEDDDDEEDDAPRGGRLAGSKRRRDEDDDDDGEEDPFYAAVAAAAAAKKARKADARAAAEEATREHIRSRAGDGEDVAIGENGHRKASRTILSNRGLTKYRNKELKNPRTAYRKKAEQAEKRRAGQVVRMRDRSAEEAGYGGEATGIRTSVTHSRKIKG